MKRVQSHQWQHFFILCEAAGTVAFAYATPQRFFLFTDIQGENPIAFNSFYVNIHNLGQDPKKKTIKVTLVNQSANTC